MWPFTYTRWQIIKAAKLVAEYGHGEYRVSHPAKFADKKICIEVRAGSVQIDVFKGERDSSVVFSHLGSLLGLMIFRYGNWVKYLMKLAKQAKKNKKIADKVEKIKNKMLFASVDDSEIFGDL